MEKYIGAKIVEAEPMYRKDAIEKGYNRLNSDEKNKDQSNDYGYHIKYEDGYESWSPAEVFEKAYRPVDNLNTTTIDMLSVNYKNRFIAEYTQLKERYIRLKVMCDKWDKEGVESLGFTPTCPRHLYNSQMKAMENYMSILEDRAVLEKIELNNPNCNE